MSSRYYIKDEISGYKTGAANELSSELKSLGYDFYAPQMGGGSDEHIHILEVVIAFISYHDFWFNLFTNITANKLDRLLSIIYSWSTKNKQDKRYKSVVSVYIKDGKSEYHYIEFDADRKYPKKELKKLLDNLKKKSR